MANACAAFLTDNYFTIMSVLAAVYIGLIAFVYPQIIKLKQDLQNNFPIIYDKFSKSFATQSYMHFLTGFLFFNICCMIAAVKTGHPVAIYINMFLTLVAIILNFLVMSKIEHYRLNVDDIYKTMVLSIDFNKNLNNKNNLGNFINVYDAIETQILFFVYKNIFSIERIKIFLGFVDIGISDYLKYRKKNKIASWSSRDKNNAYYEYPMDRLNYINQIACDTGKTDISLMIADNAFRIFDIYKNSAIMFSGFSYFQNHISRLFFYPIQKNSLSQLHIDYIYGLYIEMLKYEFKNDNFFWQHANTWLWNILRAMIDYDLRPEFINNLRNRLENTISISGERILAGNIHKIYSGFDCEYESQLALLLIAGKYNIFRLHLYRQLTNDRHLHVYADIAILKLGVELIAYMMFKGKYQQMRDYIGNTSSGYLYHLIPDNINGIIKTFFIGDSIFTNKHDYNNYTKDTEYVYKIMFICISIIADNIFKCQKRLSGRNMSVNEKNYIKSLTDRLLNMDAIDNDYYKSSLSILPNNEAYVVNQLEAFLSETEIFDSFNLKFPKNKYKSFIIKYLKVINKKIISLKQ
jgi:hypothetical protein